MSRWLRRARTRPWPAPVDGPWRSASFAVVDVETTGLDLRRDEVVSIGVVPMVGARITADRWRQVVRPSGPISVEAIKIHALTPAEVEAAPTLADVLPEVAERLRGKILVAHAAWVERSFLDRALAASGERLPDGVVDTAALARALGLHASVSHEPDLEALAAELDLPVHTPHDALGDAFTTAQLLAVLATRLEVRSDSRSLTVADLLRLTRAHPLGR